MIISSADVGSDYHILRFSFQCKVIHFKKLFFHIFNIRSKKFVSLLCRISDNCSPGTVVKLKISASCFIELTDHFLISCSNVVDQFFVCLIIFSRIFVVDRNDHLLEHLRRRRNCIFCNCVLILKLFQEFEMFYKRMHLCLYLSCQISIFQ